MREDTALGTRIVEVHNGSSLFTGDAGSGASNLRQYIIENDLLEAIVAMPEKDFYNTGIGTFIWVITNRKEERRRGYVQLIDATEIKSPLRKNLGEKNCETSEADRQQIMKLLMDFKETPQSKIFPNDEFGYWSVKVYQPQRDEQGCIIYKKGVPVIDKKSKDVEIIPFRYPGGIDGFVQNEILPYAPDAIVDRSSIETGYELSFTKYFYKPKQLRSIEEISADIRGIEERTDGLLDEILGLKAEIAKVVTQGLNPDVKMKDSGISWIGMIPEHWEVKRIASLFTGKVMTNSDFAYQHAFKFNYGTLVPKEETGDIEEYRETYVKYQVVQKDDILINGLNLNYDFISQRVAIAPYDGIITSAYIVARPRKRTNANYYTYLFKTMDSKKLFHGMGTGIRLTLSFDELKKQLVVIPPVDEQQAIVAYINEKCSKITSLISELESEIDYLKEYKQRLIADCVTGQVNVQNETI